MRMRTRLAIAECACVYPRFARVIQLRVSVECTQTIKIKLTGMCSHGGRGRGSM